tara:strand:- start:332 stop:706 length:375 start_codon:yes stop_codon:yes gene_type:complete
MKDRIARAKALLDLAEMVSNDADFGVLFVQGGPNGVLSASCAAMLDMAYRIPGEEKDDRPSIIQFVGKKRMIDHSDVIGSLRKLDLGSVAIVESDNVEEDAERLRIAAPVIFKGNSVLVATCHS